MEPEERWSLKNAEELAAKLAKMNINHIMKQVYEAKAKEAEAGLQ